MTPSHELLRAERIHAEVMREQFEIQDRYEATLPLHPDDREIEGASPSFCQAVWAFRELQMAEASARRCPVCGHKIKKRTHGKGGRPRVYCVDAHRKKACRIRKAEAACLLGCAATG